MLQKERPEGIIVQFGGQTPLSLAKPLQDALEKNPILAASGKPRARALLEACIVSALHSG